MSGPRVTTGDDSKQDYETPDDFMWAVSGLFGPIVFDLSAHAGNKKHPRYFAPPKLKVSLTGKRWTVARIRETVESLVQRGAMRAEAEWYLEDGLKERFEGRKEVVVPNRDENAYALDAFQHSWADLSGEFRSQDGGPGLLWDNCEFNDVDPWAARHKAERELGANSLLLTPAAVGSKWFRAEVAGVADVYLLNGRICFDGENSFPKDCMLSHFGPESRGRMFIWEWRKKILHRTWTLG